jgi:mRNA-degrading endonuclease YafQ of YafQ-DinJ toxin-antitoxin module
MTSRKKDLNQLMNALSNEIARLNPNGLKYFKKASKLYINKTIYQQRTLIKILNGLVNPKKQNESIKAIKKYKDKQKKPPTPPPPPPPPQVQQNFHIQGDVKVIKKYRQKNNTYQEYEVKNTTHKIIKAFTKEEAEQQFKDSLMDEYQDFEDSHISGTFGGVEITSNVLIPDTVLPSDSVEYVRMKTVDNSHIKYDFFKEETQFLDKSNKINFCVINNFVGIYESKLKIDEKRFIN